MADLSKLVITWRVVAQTDAMVLVEFTGPRGDRWVVGYLDDEGEEWKRQADGGAS